MFPQLTKRKLDPDALAVEVQQRKQGLMQEHGTDGEEEETASADEEADEDVETAQPQRAQPPSHRAQMICTSVRGSAGAGDAPAPCFHLRATPAACRRCNRAPLSRAA